MIKYDKLFALFKERGITTYVIKRDKIMGQATWQRLRTGTGGLEHRTIDNLCAFLECQPGDLMEYVPNTEPDQPEQGSGEE